MRSILKSPSDRYRSKHLIGPDLGRIWATQELFSRSLSVAIQVLFKVCAIQSLNVTILFYSAQQLTIQFLNSGSKLTIQALFMNSEPFKTLLALHPSPITHTSLSIHFHLHNPIPHRPSRLSSSHPPSPSVQLRARPCGGPLKVW